MIRLIVLLVMVFSMDLGAATLTTENYVVTIVVNCSEGNVTCDDVSYKGVSKKSGNSIELKGETWHTTCADGITPCKFLGYRFKNGSFTYLVLESGLLQVSRSESDVLVLENGTWIY